VSIAGVFANHKDDCVGMHVISFSAPHRCSCCTFPGARVPPAASRPGRSHKFRHARCESQMLTHGFVPAMARFCGFPLGRLTEACFSGCSRHSYPDFAISYFLLRTFRNSFLLKLIWNSGAANQLLIVLCANHAIRPGNAQKSQNRQCGD
jgi:hypothetical protein